MKKLIIILNLGLILGMLTSCNFEQRKVKKFFKRINAREVISASSYIFPGDHGKLYIFYKQFLSNNNVTNFEILDMNDVVINNEPAIITKLKLYNANNRLLNLFKNKNQLEDDIIVDTIFIKQGIDGSYLSFDWSENILPKELKLASVKVENLNVRSGPGKNYSVIDKLEENDDIIIDATYKNTQWFKTITFDKNSNIKYGYIYSSLTDVNEISFFNLGWFGKIGLLVSSIIAFVVLIIVLPLLLTTIFSTAGDNAVFGIILFGVLIAIIVISYEIIEGVIFELFLINLPF